MFVHTVQLLTERWKHVLPRLMEVLEGPWRWTLHWGERQERLCLRIRLWEHRLILVNILRFPPMYKQDQTRVQTQLNRWNMTETDETQLEQCCQWPRANTVTLTSVCQLNAVVYRPAIIFGFQNKSLSRLRQVCYVTVTAENERVQVCSCRQMVSLYHCQCSGFFLVIDSSIITQQKLF